MSAERIVANTPRLTQADLDAAKLLHAGKNRYDFTLEADIASVNAALSATAAAFGVELSEQDEPAKSAKPLR